jgi:hypothetical protein
MALTTTTSRNNPSRTVIRVAVMEAFPRSRKSVERNGGKRFKRTKTMTVYGGTFDEVLKLVSSVLNGGK